MKKLFVLSLTVIFFLSLSQNPAFAGSKQRYQWQGFALGVGAAILGSAILNNGPPPQPVAVIDRGPYPCSCPPPRHDYCETQRVWVPPVYERVWNPGHYEYSRWVPGQWINLEAQSGYWREERSWGYR